MLYAIMLAAMPICNWAAMPHEYRVHMRAAFVRCMSAREHKCQPDPLTNKILGSPYCVNPRQT
jgi:hypothetical protein